MPIFISMYYVYGMIIKLIDAHIWYMCASLDTYNHTLVPKFG